MQAGLLRNMTWLGAGNLAVKPLWFLFRAFALMNVLGTEGFGVIGASLSMALLAAGFADWGVTPYSTREVARDQEAASAYFSNFLTMRLALTLTAIGIALGGGFVLQYDMGALALAGAYVLGLALVEYCRAFYRAFEILKYESISIVVEKILVIGFGVVALWWTRTATGTLGGMALGMTLTLLLNLMWIHARLAPMRRDRLSSTFVKKALPIALPLGLASMFVVLYTRTDLIMLYAMQGDTAAGQYDGAYRLVEILVLLPTVVVAAVFPRLSRLFKEQQGAVFAQVLRSSLLGAVGISLGIAVVLSAFGPEIMRLLTILRAENDFVASGELLRLFAWLFPLMTANYIMNIALNAADDQRMLAVILGLGAILNVAVNLALIPRYSIYGACAATLMTQGGILIALALRYWTHTRPHLRASSLEV